MKAPGICVFCDHPFAPIAFTLTAVRVRADDDGATLASMVSGDDGIPVMREWIVPCQCCGARVKITAIVIGGPKISAEELARKRNVNR